MFRQMLLNGASRATFAPEDDDGFDPDGIDEPIEYGEDEELDPEDDEPEEPDEDEGQDEEPAPRQPSRGENRVATAARIAAEAKAEAKALREEIAAIRASQSRAPTETTNQRNERLAQMEPWERTEFLINERMAAAEWNMNERADKSAFAQLCASDPVAAKLKDDVEARLATMRAQGQTVDRETLYTFMLGERAKANRGRATGRAVKNATANRERQQARPSNSRGDVAPSDRRGGNTASARDKRLENLII